MRIIIFGAGSVGTHYARAWSKVTRDITIVDSDPKALARFENSTWPSRYGSSLPSEFRLAASAEFEWSGNYDVAVIGTPPSSHGQLLNQVINSRLAANVCVQKPISPPVLEEIFLHMKLESLAAELGIRIFSGYNHRYSPAFSMMTESLKELQGLPEIRVSVEWKESWDGILRAHPWLNGPEDSYLGFTSRGGGACFEHSHGLDLGLFVWQELERGTFSHLDSRFDVASQTTFDRNFNFEGASSKTKSQLKVSQDVLSRETIKRVSVEHGEAVFCVEFSQDVDVFSVTRSGLKTDVEFKKNRETDFDEEVKTVILEAQKPQFSIPIGTSSFSRALNTSILATVCYLEYWAKEPSPQLVEVLENRLTLVY